MYDLSTYVLGLKPAAPGFARFDVSPWFGDLEWARGSMPTPAGPISLAWQRAHGSIKLEITVPEGLSGILRTGKYPQDPNRAGDDLAGRTGGRSLRPGVNSFSLPAP